MTGAASEVYRDYYRHVELHWSLKREHQIIVSPIEFEKIHEWHEAEVPLAVVLEAINVFIEKKKKAKRQKSWLLSHVDGTVLKLFGDWQNLHEGEGDDEEDLLASKLKGLVRKLKAVIRDWPEEKSFLDELVTRVKAFDPQKIIRFEDLDQALADLDQELIAHFQARLNPHDAKAIRDDVEDLLKEEEDPEFFRKMIQDSIRSHFGLPRLILLG